MRLGFTFGISQWHASSLFRVCSGINRRLHSS